MKKKVYNALDVACFIINYCNSNGLEITNLRLQKLLYFVQAYSFIERKKEFFENDIEAWTYGPAIPEVYNEFSIYMGNQIYPTTRYKVYNKESIFVHYIDYDESIFCKSDKNLIVSVIETLREKTSYELVDITHAQLPWANAINRGIKHIIDKEDINKYFNYEESSRYDENYK